MELLQVYAQLFITDYNIALPAHSMGSNNL
jgi:hypothetical protein